METSEATPTQEAQPETSPQPEGTGETVSKSDYDKLLTKSRQNEDRAKANMAAAKELEALRATSMSETEKAVKAARDEGKLEGLREGSSKIVFAEIRAAVAGRPVDADALVEGIDAARFIGDDGEVDRMAIVGWVDKVAPIPTDPEPSTSVPLFPDLGQGSRGAPALNSTQLEKDLKAALHI